MARPHQDYHESCVASRVSILVRFFFFQAEDGIRDKLVTGVQTCALPILTFAASVRGRVIVNEGARRAIMGGKASLRSEEHTSELQSLAYLVCRLLLEKKKKELKRSSLIVGS